MIDCEKVINGLECCYIQKNGVPPRCEACPYMNPMEGTCDSLDELLGDALALLKAQESPTSECISSAIECLLHPQDADDSDMAKAIDTAVRAMRLLKEQEAVEPVLDIDTWKCGNCGHALEHQQLLGDNVLWHEQYNYCPECGRVVKWE